VTSSGSGMNVRIHDIEKETSTAGIDPAYIVECSCGGS